MVLEISEELNDFGILERGGTIPRPHAIKLRILWQPEAQILGEQRQNIVELKPCSDIESEIVLCSESTSFHLLSGSPRPFGMGGPPKPEP